MMKRIVLLLLLSVFILPPIWSQGKYKITAPSLNVRLAPNAKSKILGTLNQNDIIVVKSIENQWARITFMGKDAYISAKYIVKAEDDNVKNSTEKANDFELHSVEEKNFEKIKTGKHNIDSVFNNWGIDFLLLFTLEHQISSGIICLRLILDLDLMQGFKFTKSKMIYREAGCLRLP